MRALKKINTPIDDSVINSLAAGDLIAITGQIYTGRDAVLPKVAAMIDGQQLEEHGIFLQGSVIFHTAVSPAGVGPTSSNKLEIESNIPKLSQAGVKIHLGKGDLQDSTVEALHEFNSIYAVVPPVTALLGARIRSKKIVAFPEEGMEALHLLEVIDFPAIVVAAHGAKLTRGSEDNE